jgi:tetratricopeptide (TPR) repeat protein
MDNSDYGEAVKWFSKLLSYEPGSAEYHADIGICYYKLLLKKEALMHAQYALNLAPEHLPAKELMIQLSR